jgi:hypothetical protein
MEFQILGLKNFVQDDVNHVIAKFVGVKPRPFTDELKNLVRFFENWPGDEEDTFSKFVFCEILHCCTCNRILKSSRLGLCEECEEHELETP